MPRPTLHQLEIFCRVVRLGSMARAADDLYLSPASVSMQVQQLERKYLVTLLDRTPRGVALTEAGRALYARASAVLDSLTAAEDDLARLKALESGVLQFAASRTVGSYLVPLVLSEFERMYPHVSVEYQIQSGGERAKFAVLDRRVEFALLGRITSDQSLDVEPLVSEPLRPVVSPRHPLADRARAAVADIGRHTLVLREDPILGRREIVDRVEASGITPSILEMRNTETIKAAAIEGKGIAFLPASCVAAEIASGLLHTLRVSGLMLYRTAYLVRCKRSELSAPARTFITLVAGLFSAETAPSSPKLPMPRQSEPAPVDS